MSVAAGAEGGGGASAVGGVYEGDNDSSVMASLGAMFPTLDHDVIATVLQSHDGCLETAVEYLMAMCRAEVGGAEIEVVDVGGADVGEADVGEADVGGYEKQGPEIEAYHEIHSEFEGQFSDDIGGLPELVPSFIFDPTEEEEEEDEEYLREDFGGPPELLPNFVYGPTEEEDFFDPLPSYEEACQPQVEVGPPPYPSSLEHSIEPSRSAVINMAASVREEEREEEGRGELVEEPATAMEEEESVMEGGGVQREEEVEFRSRDRTGTRAARSSFEDDFVPAAENRPVRKQLRPPIPLEDDESDEELTYGDHSRHWTRLGSPTRDATPTTSHRKIKVRKLAGKMKLRRGSKEDYKSQQRRLEASVGAKGPPVPLRKLVDESDDEPTSD